MINVVDNQRGAPDHKHTYIHVLSYGIVPYFLMGLCPLAGLCRRFSAKRRASPATAVSFLLPSRH